MVEIVIDSTFFFAKSQTRNWDNIVRGGLLHLNFSTKLNERKMQKTLTTTALIFAGISGLMAENNIQDKISGCDYSNSVCYWDEDVDSRGSNSVNGVSNYYWNELKIDLREDARYHLLFQVTSNDGSDSTCVPVFNLYLAAPRNSILFGNYFDVGTIGNRGAAGVFHLAGTSVANADVANGHSTTYILNRYVDDIPGVNWYQSTQKRNPGASGKLADGGHVYEIFIESFADSSKADKIMFKYTKDGGSSGWTPTHNISEYGNIDPNSVLDFGYFLDSDSEKGGTITVTHAMVDKDFRTVTPTVPPPAPEPEKPSSPDVPEPSAFGLLAGLGAITLAASRRRRSR